MRKLDEIKKRLGSKSRLSRQQASRLKGGASGDTAYTVPPPPPDVPSSGDGGYGG